MNFDLHEEKEDFGTMLLTKGMKCTDEEEEGRRVVAGSYDGAAGRRRGWSPDNHRVLNACLFVCGPVCLLCVCVYTETIYIISEEKRGTEEEAIISNTGLHMLFFSVLFCVWDYAAARNV